MLFPKEKISYLFTEVILIFIGISLAIWFNNWNESRKIKAAKHLISSKIFSEINENRLEIENNVEHLDSVIKTLSSFVKISGFANNFKTSIEKMEQFQKDHPGFYTIKESDVLPDGELHEFKGSISLQFEISNIKFIALETAKNTDILSTIPYDCLFKLEELYGIKYRIARNFNRAAELLQEGDLKKLIQNLKQINQLQNQLLRLYGTTNLDFNEC